MAKTNLSFTQGGDGRYYCEFTINEATALHIERSGYGPIGIGQKSDADGHYATVKGWHFDDQFVVDVDLTANVYPKYIRVTVPGAVSKAYKVV